MAYGFKGQAGEWPMTLVLLQHAGICMDREYLSVRQRYAYAGELLKEGDKASCLNYALQKIVGAGLIDVH